MTIVEITIAQVTIAQVTIAQATFALAAIVQVTIVQNRHKGIESGSWEERTWTEAHFEAHFCQIQVEERAENTPFVVTDLDVAVILMASGWQSFILFFTFEALRISQLEDIDCLALIRLARYGGRHFLVFILQTSGSA